jgi:predicted O-methyltransferase YrrM
MLAKLIRPVNILEIGTYTGYSACVCVKECKKTEHCTPLTLKKNWLTFKENILTSRLGERNYTPGRSSRYYTSTGCKFDLVFIDADKENYINLFHHFAKMNKGRLSFLTMSYGAEGFRTVTDDISTKNTGNTMHY